MTTSTTLRPSGARFIVLALSLAAAACGGSEPRAADAPQLDPLPVTTAAVVAQRVADRLEAGGTVTAGERVSLSSRIVAPVNEVRVRAGDRVRAGQVLVVLDDRDLGAHVRQSSAASVAAEQAVIAARAEVAAASAEQTLAAAWHARLSTLRSRNAATAQEFDEADARRVGADARVRATEARLSQATAGLDAARAIADIASTTQSFSVLSAPFDGIVTERLVDPGTLATPGLMLLRLDATGVTRVTAQVDESRVRYLPPGARVVVAVGTASSDESLVEGTVTEVARTTDANPQSFVVHVALPRGADVTTGAFARIRFNGPDREALVLPAGAIRRQGQVATVFVVNDGVARMRLVQVVDLGADRAEVVAGLAAGDVVIASPPAALADGRRVVSGSRP